MPTLLSINNYYYPRGGAETVFLEHNRMFAELDWNVVPFAMQHAKNLPTPWSEYFIEEIEFGARYSFVEQLRRVPKVIYSLEARRKLGALAALVRPDICHAHNIYHHISPSILSLLKSRGIPTVVTLHDLKIACPAYNMLAPDGICERCRGGKLYNVLLHRCVKGSAALSAVVMAEAMVHRILGTYRNCVSRFVVPSRFYMDKLASWGMPAGLFRHVPNFVDAERYRPQFAPGTSFAYFGRVSPEKGVATLIRAAAAAGAALEVIGTGVDLEAMRSLAAEVGASVRFHGFLSGEALQHAVRGARAVVLPSEWYENAPMSVLEAYALGKPVIGARIGGIPELIRENVTGVSFESANVAALSAALREVMQRADDAVAAMGAHARQWVASDFSAAVYRARILAIYAELGVPERHSASA